MAANTCTSTTATISGTDPDFTLTKEVRNRKEGVFLYLKYAIGTSTSITLVVKSICNILSSTDQYQLVTLSGTAISALTYTISAAGNYKIPIALSEHDNALVVTITPNASAQGAAITANVMDA